MTSVIDPSTVPFLPTKDTALRLRHFDPSVYNLNESSALYSYADAMLGDAGVGTLKKQQLINRLNQSLDTTHFTDLDASFGNIFKLARQASETYSFAPATDLLTSDQWSEIQVKDAWYRARIKCFFTALGHGGTPDGLRLMIKAALGVDCEIYEMWRFQDHYAEIYGFADVEAITNAITTPSFEYGSAGWSVGASGSVGAVLSTTKVLPAAVFSGTSCLLWNLGTSGSNATIVSDTFSISAAKVYTFSFYYYRPAATPLTTIQPSVDWYGLGGGLISTSVVAATTSTADVLTRLSYTVTAPASAVTAISRIGIPGAVSGSPKIYVDAVMFQATATVQPYFDGDTSGYRWTGQPGQSASIKSSPIDALSRARVPSRNEVILYPHKDTISTLEMLQAREMTRRLAPVDSVITITNHGYAVNVPVPIIMARADSRFFQVNSYVIGKSGTQLTPVEEPNASFRWLRDDIEVLAPRSAFGATQEFSTYYLYAKGNDSTIDTVVYSSETAKGAKLVEKPYISVVEAPDHWGPWIIFDVADSPDNYPGGKTGHNPKTKPAIYARSPYSKYVFPYKSQADYVARLKPLILKVGGQMRGTSAYRLPISGAITTQNTWVPEEAVLAIAPVKSSTVTSGWYLRPNNSDLIVGF